MTRALFYLVEYAGEEHGLPAFVNGRYNQEKFEWNILDPKSACDVPILKSYEFKVTDRSLRTLGFDFYDPDSPVVSRAFLAVCDELAVKYRAVPLTVTFANKKAPSSQEFFLFLPCQSAALLNRDSSDFREERVVETGEVMRDKYFPPHPIYAWIRYFDVTPTPLHLFHCIELLQLVSSEQFRALASKRELKGLRFVALDESFRYDPWHELGS